MSTTIGGVRIADMPDLGAVNDSSSVVGERAGSGRFAATQFRDYTNMVTATGSTTPRSNADRWSTIANVLDYGAIGDNVHDDTAAFQAAIATGKRVYMPRPPVAFRITNAINCTTPGQVIEGDGKGVTIIAIPSSFNLSAQGVFVCPGGPWVPGPQFRDFQINFAQPDTTDTSALVHYPAAFYCQSVARATWHRIKINAAMVGIDLRLNAAGASIVDCELCCFDWHIYLDGEADSITVQSCRFEPDLLTANQTTIYHGAARGILSGRCDDLHVIGCLFYCSLGIQLIVSADGTSSTIGNVTNCDFDTYAGINIAAGNLEVSGCDFTMGASTGYAVEMAGGNLSMSACWFLATVTLAGGMIQTSASVGITLQISASRFDMAASTNHSAVASFTNGIVILNGCHFNMPQTTRTLAAVSITDAVLLTMNGCRFTPKGAASGAVLSVSLDGAHNVCGNVFGGWAASIPGTTRVFANNVA